MSGSVSGIPNHGDVGAKGNCGRRKGTGIFEEKIYGEESM